MLLICYFSAAIIAAAASLFFFRASSSSLRDYFRCCFRFDDIAAFMFRYFASAQCCRARAFEAFITPLLDASLSIILLLLMPFRQRYASFIISIISYAAAAGAAFMLLITTLRYASPDDFTLRPLFAAAMIFIFILIFHAAMPPDTPPLRLLSLSPPLSLRFLCFAIHNITPL